MPLDSTQDAVAKGNASTATPTGADNCPIPLDTGLLNVDVLCGNASASEDANGNPTAKGTGSIADALAEPEPHRRVAGHLGRVAARRHRSLCGSAPAASADPGSNTNPLSGPVQSLLGTVNGILPANLALNPTSVAGGSDLAGECSVVSGLLTQLDAAGGSQASSVLTGILNQVLGLTGGNAGAVQPLVITLGGSTASVSTSGNTVTDSVTQQRASRSTSSACADLQVAPTSASVALDRSSGTVTPSCNAGVVSYATNGSLPTFVNITQIDALVNQILQTLGSAGSALSSAAADAAGRPHHATTRRATSSRVTHRTPGPRPAPRSASSTSAC